MKTEIPARSAVPFPPIRSPGKQQEPRRAPKKKVQPPQPPTPQPAAAPSFSHSWPKAAFQLGGVRRPQQQEQQQQQQRLLPPRTAGGSCASSPPSTAGKSSSPAGAGAGEAEQQRFSLSLTPEAVLVIQKRNLERRLQQQQQHRLTARPRGKAPPCCPAEPPPADVGSLLKISLLNEQHKYDDVEYEEDGGPPDRSVLHKCLEWLQGVENARGPTTRQPGLPQLAS
ncbi:proline-rich protein 18 [Amblyraja radiata]|uniref:proline-rich protein 18 n=1 Tax=Amblyraja radiata TaxID=386614 RepID=UPI001403427D|nr:proline-rich protein 18 [Amblyraja radiata]